MFNLSKFDKYLEVSDAINLFQTSYYFLMFLKSKVMFFVFNLNEIQHSHFRWKNSLRRLEKTIFWLLSKSGQNLTEPLFSFFFSRINLKKQLTKNELKLNRNIEKKDKHSILLLLHSNIQIKHEKTTKNNEKDEKSEVFEKFRFYSIWWGIDSFMPRIHRESYFNNQKSLKKRKIFLFCLENENRRLSHVPIT